MKKRIMRMLISSLPENVSTSINLIEDSSGINFSRTVTQLSASFNDDIDFGEGSQIDTAIANKNDTSKCVYASASFINVEEERREANAARNICYEENAVLEYLADTWNTGILDNCVLLQTLTC